MNVDKLVWDNSELFYNRLEQLRQECINCRQHITNRKKIPFDLYYKFPTSLDNMTWNNKWKVLTLAIDVLKIVKRWTRKYNINCKKKLSGDIFVNYFKNSIDVSKFNLCTIGINFYHRKGYTLKTFMMWANKLCKLGIISNIKFNNFMEELERISNGKE